MPRNFTAVCIGLVPFFFFCIFWHRVDALTLSPSQNMSVSAIVGTLPMIDTGGTGGSTTSQSGVRFSGFAYPGAVITIQSNSINPVMVTADANGQFNVFVPGTTVPFYTLFATDMDGRRSTLINFPITFYSGYLTDISNIRFAPTIATDKLAVKRGNYLSITGAAVPNTPLQVTIDGSQTILFTLAADATGRYSLTVPITLSPGAYNVSIGYSGDTRVSKVIRVTVGTNDIYATEATNNIPGDCNFDEKISIVDFSVLAYWYGKKNPPPCVDLNKDGVVTLVDFSIMAFYWNG